MYRTSRLLILSLALLCCTPSAYGKDVPALVEGVKAAVKEKAPCWKLFHQQGRRNIGRAEKNAVRFARLFVEQLSAPPNNGMHPTADTMAFMYNIRSGRRVMPGVRFLAGSGSEGHGRANLF